MYGLSCRANKKVSSLYLPRGLDAFDHGQAHHGPGSQQAYAHPPVQAPAVRDGVGDVQGHAVPVISGG